MKSLCDLNLENNDSGYNLEGWARRVANIDDNNTGYEEVEDKVQIGLGNVFDFCDFNFN